MKIVSLVRSVRCFAMFAAVAGIVGMATTNANALDAAWNVDAAGNWNDPLNWNPNTTFPNGVDQFADLEFQILTNRIITIPASTSITAGVIYIGAPTANRIYTVAAGAGGSLTMDVLSGNAVIQNTGAAAAGPADVISAPITLNDNLAVSNIATGAITASNLTLSGIIGGLGKSIIVGTGAATDRAVTLSGANTFDGGVTLKSGILVTNATGLGSGLLTLAGGELRGPGATTALPNNINVTGNSTITPLSIANGNSTWTLNGTLSSNGLDGAGPVLTLFQPTANFRGVTFNGDISGFKGTFKTTENPSASFGNPIALGTTAALVDGSHAKFLIDSSTGNAIGIGNTSTMRLGYIEGGTTKMGELSGSGRFGMVGSALNYTLEVGALGTDSTFSGDIVTHFAAGQNGSHYMDLKKVGAGSLTLSGENSYVGNTTIANGTLVAGVDALVSTSNASNTTGASTLTGSVFTSNSYVLVPSVVYTPAPNNLSNGDRVFVELGLDTVDQPTLQAKPMFVVNKSGNTYQLSATLNGAPQTFNTASATGAVSVAMPTAFGAGTTPIALGDGTGGAVKLLAGTVLNSSVTIARGVTVAAGGGVPTLGSEVDGNSTFSGAITLGKDLNITSASTGPNKLTISGNISSSGAFGFTKFGAGKAVVSGTNNYSGTTNVSAGTLLLNGTHTGGAGYTVSSNATLGGTGSTTSNVVVDAGGTLSPGASIESLDVGGAAINGKLAVEYQGVVGLGNDLIDLLNVAGGLNITNATLDLASLGGTVDDTALIFAKYGSLAGTQFVSVTGVLPASYAINYAYNDGVSSNNIALVRVPEPCSIALAGMVLLGLCFRRSASNRGGR